MDVVAEKPFFWSYSRLTSFETCPRRFYETQVSKTWPTEESEQLKWGNDAHKALAKALRGTPLPTRFKDFRHWVDKVLNSNGELLVEEDCRWAITPEFKPTTWLAKDVWLRCIADAVKLNDDHALVVDWKAGKSSNADPVQLTLTSLMMFAHFPQLQAVRSDFIWLQENDKTTQSIYRHEAPDHWAEIMPRVERLRKATMVDSFPPTPNRYCRSWCPVKNCEFWGK